MAKYLSKAWVDRGRVEVEKDERFQRLSQGVQASILCVVHEQPVHADEVFFIDFENGHIRDIFSGPLSEFEARGITPTFAVHGDYDTYRAIQEGDLTQTTALMKGRLKLKGSMLKALKHIRTLEAVTDVLRTVPTEF